MFVDKFGVAPSDYVCMMFLLNITQQAGYSAKVNTVLDSLKHLMSRTEAVSCLSELGEKNLVQFIDADDKPIYEFKTDGAAGLTFAGMAFLVNYANEYIEEINKQYGDLPEKLVATLVPFLDLSAVPAADRYVKTTDNLPEFKELES